MSGTISGYHTAAITLTVGSYSDPVTNLGTINPAAAGDALYAASAWTVVNQGSIGALTGSTADAGIFLAAGGAVTNATGAVIAGAGTGIDATNGALTVTNSGFVTAGNSGVALARGGIVTNLSTGTIMGVHHGFYGVTGGAMATLVNYGRVVSDLYAAVILASGGEVTNEAGGTITSADTNGIYVTRGAGAIFNAGVVAATGYSGIALMNGGTVTNAHGGTISSVQGDAVYVTGATGVVVNAGLLTATSFSGIVLENGGTVTNAHGGTISSVQGDAVYVTAGAGVVVNAGLLTASYHSAVVLLDGGTVSNLSTGIISGVYARAAAATVVTSGTLGGAALGAGFANRLVVEPGAVFAGPVDGGNTIGAAATSTLELAAGSGTLAGVGVAIGRFGAVSFDAGAAWLISGNTYGLAGGQAITGFGAGDTIELTGTVESYGALGGGALTLSGGTVLDLPGVGHVGVSGDGSNTFITACFAGGTGIATARGRVVVEALREGDLVCTASGRLAAISWIGSRRTDLPRHPRPHDVMPVRVTAGAFGPLLPSRDVILSPDHAVFVDGMLVPVRHLINGVSILQETREAVTYWHVELDRHDVILAEDLPCESFLDTGNRCAFDNAPGAVAMTPDFARAVWDERGCAPILTDPADARLRALHLRLLAEARRRERAA
jgi:hypothetical protein